MKIRKATLTIPDEVDARIEEALAGGIKFATLAVRALDAYLPKLQPKGKRK